MRALITGGAGFLGFHLASRLADDGHDVILVDNFVRGRSDPDLEELLRRPNVRLIRGDLEAPDLLGRIDGDVDHVYHLAAVIGVRHVLADPARVLRVNARTLLNVVEFVTRQEPCRLFFASTSEVYAWSARFTDIPIPTPEAVPLAVDDVGNRRASYALSKIFGEMVCLHGLAHGSGGVVCGRFHNVYGPRMGTAHVIPELFLRMRGGEMPLRVREARATRAFCHVDDAVSAMVHLMEGGHDGVYNIGNAAEEITVGELARRIARRAGYPEESLELVEEDPAIPRRCPDVTRLRSTGFVARRSLDEGLADTLRWYAHADMPLGI